MLQTIAFGLAAGAGIQAWRAWPASQPVSGDALAVVFCAGVVLAYLGGRWKSRGGATATAVATAVASAEATAQNHTSVQLAIVVPGQGARPNFGVPTDEASWLQGAVRPEITADDLDGMDLSELFSVQETETTQ